MKKITFIGDIMCEEPLLHASKHGHTYDFSQVFSGCKGLFSESDFVVGNLETVFAGSESGYTKSLFSFNTPDEFAEAMARSGIDMVTTATNHTLDRDKAGLIRTLDLLDRLNIAHIGANRTEIERKTVYCKKFDGQRVAFLNYTYGTNLNESPFLLSDDEYYLLNLLMPQKKVKSNRSKGLKGLASKAVYRIIPMKYLLMIKKMLRRNHVNQYNDTLDTSNLKKEYLERIRQDVLTAKEKSDLLIVCLHIGGQFNEVPGDQVRYFTKLFSDLGVDYLINTHAHVVQSSEKINSTFVAYCLGNFSISPSSIYVPHELKPEYSIALHLYIGDEEPKIGFSILKIVESKNHNIEVFPVNVLAEELNEADTRKLQYDVTFIYNRFTGMHADKVPIQSEYMLEV